MEDMDEMKVLDSCEVSKGAESVFPDSRFQIPHLTSSSLSWPSERGHRARRK